MAKMTESSAESVHSGIRADISFSAVIAGFVTVAVAYSGPMLVVLQAAESAGLSPDITQSWVWAISIASGITCVVLSLVSRQPVVVAWSVPGAALLIRALGSYEYSDAVGAYVMAALMSLLLSLTGIFGRLLSMVPSPIMAAVLAGVLLPFVLNVASAVVQSPLVAGGLVAAFVLGRRIMPRYAVLLALVVGAGLSAAAGQVSLPSLEFNLGGPAWTVPTFSFQAFLGIAVPITVVTMAGQNGPGLAVMHSYGYKANDRIILGGTSVAWLLTAPLGAHGINLAAIAAGICAGRESHSDVRRRYVAAVFAGLFFILFGLFSTTAVALFSSLPTEMMAALAGVAIVGALQSSLSDSLSGFNCAPQAVEAALITLVVTSSGISPWGIVSPFWGLLAGSVSYLLLRTCGRKTPSGQ
jgi:benzoate membrane transport protein